MVRCGVVWCGVVRCGAVWCGVVWCGVVWCDVVWCGVVRCGVVRCGVKSREVCGVLTGNVHSTQAICLSSSCESVREVVMRQTEKWQWSVAWLKKKVNKCTHAHTHTHAP